MQQTATLPESMKHLRICPERGVIVPWFVSWIGGKPEFRLADASKVATAINQRRCWVCGKRLGPTMTFVLGPMCGVNRISAEPPCHGDCAVYSARACPFLSKPRMHRRDHEAVAALGDCPGNMIERNPGVTLLWTTARYALKVLDSGVLFEVGDPIEVAFYREGRPAGEAEVLESVQTGLPVLRAMAEEDGAAAVAQLAAMTATFVALIDAYFADRKDEA